MKTKLITFCSIAALLMVSSCTKDPYSSDFQTSYNAWLKFKNERKNSYSYGVKTTSFSGYITGTTITVENGVVIKRSFSATTPGSGPNPQLVIQEMWTEDRNTINTHKNGAPAKTLDEIYTEVKNDWLKRRSNTTTVFETKNQGMISTAGYVEDNCADDCFRGINIAFIGVLYCCGVNI